MAVTSKDIKNFSDQFQYSGDGPLDVKQKPVETISELPSRLRAYEGQTITVMSDPQNETADYQFVNGKWVKKFQIMDCGEF